MYMVAFNLNNNIYIKEFKTINEAYHYINKMKSTFKYIRTFLIK